VACFSCASAVEDSRCNGRARGRHVRCEFDFFFKKRVCYEFDSKNFVWFDFSIDLLLHLKF